jgi:hypothetical protein
MILAAHLKLAKDEYCASFGPAAFHSRSRQDGGALRRAIARRGAQWAQALLGFAGKSAVTPLTL